MTTWATLAGGVGAARFLRGLRTVVEPAALTIIGNTGDDEEFYGLPVSPDLDTVVYTLAGAANPETGWGLAGDTFETVDAVARYGLPTWFRLGDRDLATHLYRAQRLRDGVALSQITTEIAQAWGVPSRLLPMSDDRVRTRIVVAGDDGPEDLPMQEWFVARRAEPTVLDVRFAGAREARPAPGVLEALETADAVVVCPSNPVISIGPILAVPGIREVLSRRRDRVVAVSPIVSGAPVRGPADRLMAPLDIEVSCVGVARHYREFCGTLVLDARDASRAPEVERLGLRAVVADTLMRDVAVASELARQALAAVA